MRGVQGVDRREEGEIWQIALASNISSRLENLLGLGGYVAELLSSHISFFNL